MNNSLYNNTNYIPNQMYIPQPNNYRENYVEEYLRNNLGKRVEAHVAFCDSIEWRDSVFNGILESIGKDYIVIKNNQNNYVIWSVYINYIIINNLERDQ